MKTFITRHWGELDKEVLQILEAHPGLWDTITKEDLLHTDFYDVLDENGNLVALFGNAHWNNNGETECCLCCVYVKEEHRRKGIFKKIVHYTVNHNSDAACISIGAMDGNDLAFDIYSKMFKLSHHDEETRGTWFLIKDRRSRP